MANSIYVCNVLFAVEYYDKTTLIFLFLNFIVYSTRGNPVLQEKEFGAGVLQTHTVQDVFRLRRVDGRTIDTLWCARISAPPQGVELGSQARPYCSLTTLLTALSTTPGITAARLAGA
jgi:hypothetical protein